MSAAARASSASAPLAELRDAVKRFGATTALDGVTLAVGEGEMVGLLGPNGAGKSTMLSLLQGLRAPTSGTVRLFGGDPADARSRVRLGCTPQETALPATLRVGEVVDLVRAHFLDPVPTAELADRFGFADLLRRQTGGLSGGQRRRVSVALAFAGRPRLVLLDEPTTGLDVDARYALWEALRRERAAGTTLVVTSHYLEEIEALAERVVVVDGGRVLVDDQLERVLARVASRRVTLAVPGGTAVDGLAGVLRADRAGADPVDGWIPLALAVHDSDAFVRDLVASRIPFRDLAVRGASLEEAFLALTAERTDAA